MYRLPSTEASSSSATEASPPPHTHTHNMPLEDPLLSCPNCLFMWAYIFTELIIGFESAGLICIHCLFSRMSFV